MLEDTPGIHHVTGIVGDAQSNVDFYTGVLGLRLVKRTVNHEDVLRYHLYYGNADASLGSLLTSFPYPGDPPGRVGKPQVAAVGLVVPPDSLDYWADRLASFGVAVDGPVRRFDERVLRFEDPAGTRVELVTGESPIDPWTGGAVPEGVAVRGIHSVTVLPTNPYATASTLETLGFDLAGEESETEVGVGTGGGGGEDGSGTRVRYRASGEAATVVDVLDRDAPYGREGPGTLHHVAVRVGEEADLFDWHDLFRERDYDVSRVRDRIYFRSLYVRDPGGVLFELATEGPGLALDEPDGSMGESLVLPDWAEEDREMIESQLPALSPPRSDVDRP